MNFIRVLIIFFASINFGISQKSFGFEISYGVTKAYNLSEVLGTMNSLYEVKISEESNIFASNYNISFIAEMFKNQSIKIGLGIFQNGRKFSFTINNPHYHSQFTGVTDRYKYKSLSLSHVYSILLNQNNMIEIENGISVVKITSVGSYFLLLTNKYNFHYFLKAGFRRQINPYLSMAIKSQIFKGLGDFIRKDTFEKGYNTLSIGIELSIKLDLSSLFSSKKVTKKHLSIKN